MLLIDNKHINSFIKYTKGEKDKNTKKNKAQYKIHSICSEIYRV